VKIVVIDGQGGRLGKALIEGIREARVPCEVIAVGANAIATQTMLGAKPDGAATGEYAAIFNSRDADYIIGPIGIIVSGALLGEISPGIAVAVAESPAIKILLPENKCGVYIAGITEASLTEQIRQAVARIAKEA
jgi:hypothetical protein